MSQTYHAGAETRPGFSDEVGTVALNLALSSKTDAELGRLAEDIGGDKIDVFKRALALLSLAVDARKHGRRMAIVNEEGQIESEITGV